MPTETGELLEKALNRARDSTASQTPELADDCWAVQQADAVVIVENEQREPLSVGRKTRTVPACGYQLQDMTDNDIGELSNLFNIPSAEGIFTAVISSAVNSPPV